MRNYIRISIAAISLAAGLCAHADPLSVQATMVRREGTTAGAGLLDGAQIVEFGRHDIVPGVAGDPSGYLVATKGEGNIAYIKWTVRAVFLPGKDGKPELNDNGFWEVVSGTGSFKSLKGAGTLHIKSANPTDRIFILDGKIAAAN